MQIYVVEVEQKADKSSYQVINKLSKVRGVLDRSIKFPQAIYR
jgi:hypothetical protein